MKRIRRFFLLAVAAILVFGFAGCGIILPGNMGTGIGRIDTGKSGQENMQDPVQPDGEGVIVPGNNGDTQKPAGPEGDAVIPPGEQENPQDPSEPGEEAVIITECDEFSPEYLQVIQPVNDAALYMLKDMAKKGQLNMTFHVGTTGETATQCILDGLVNPRLTSIRYFYGRSLTFYIQGDRFCGDGAVSSYLRNCYGVDLEGFGERYPAVYGVAQEFFKNERLLRGKSNYVEVVLPIARRLSEGLLGLYRIYNGQPSCFLSGDGQSIYVNKDTPEEYEFLRDVLNGYITRAKERDDSDSPYNDYQERIELLPLIRDCEIQVGFGGFQSQITGVQFEIHSDNANITIVMPLDIKDEQITRSIKYHMGTLVPGYATSLDPTPGDNEYFEFFKTLVNLLPERESIIHTSFRTRYGEDTFIYLPGSMIVWEGVAAQNI